MLYAHIQNDSVFWKNPELIMDVVKGGNVDILKLIEPHIEFDPLEYAAHCSYGEMFEYLYSHPKSRKDVDGKIRRKLMADRQRYF